MQEILTLDFISSVVESVIETKNEISKFTKLKIVKKGQGNFVTDVDLKIQNNLSEKLLKLLPESGIIGEESLNQMSNGFNWIIDPIDGTSNFLYGYDFAVSLALKYKNEILLGVVYNPHNDQLFFGVKGKGSYFIKDRKVNQLEIEDFPENEGFIIIGMPYDRTKAHKIFSLAEQLYTIASDIKRVGPASIDICRVAQNKAKLYCEFDLNVWDTAAGELILREAGGIIKRKKDLWLFGSAKSVDQACKIIDESSILE